jgi:hypothetical protein
MSYLLRNLFAFEAPETQGERVFFRVLELFIVGFTAYLAWGWAIYTQQIETVVLPLGIAEYVDISFMFSNGISLIVAVLLSATLFLGALRIYPAISYWIALICFHLLYVARYCLGEISHGSNMLGMSVLSLAVAFTVFGSPVLQRKFALGFIYFFVGLGYTLAAFCKLVGTGIHWPDGRHLWMWISERGIDLMSSFGSFDPNIVQELILADYRYGTVVLAFGLVTEFFGFLAWFRRTRFIIIPAIIGMHMGILVTMNIFFDAWTFQLILLGLPWAVMIERWLRRTSSAEASVSPAVPA